MWTSHHAALSYSFAAPKRRSGAMPRIVDAGWLGESDSDEEDSAFKFEFDDTDYDPRKPEYIISAPPEEAQRTQIELLQKQIGQLEGFCSKQGSSPSEVVSHYRAVAEELRQRIASIEAGGEDFNVETPSGLSSCAARTWAALHDPMRRATSSCSTEDDDDDDTRARSEASSDVSTDMPSPPWRAASGRSRRGRGAAAGRKPADAAGEAARRPEGCLQGLMELKCFAFLEHMVAGPPAA